jgi:hypothetical protein
MAVYLTPLRKIFTMKSGLDRQSTGCANKAPVPTRSRENFDSLLKHVKFVCSRHIQEIEELHTNTHAPTDYAPSMQYSARRKVRNRWLSEKYRTCVHTPAMPSDRCKHAIWRAEQIEKVYMQIYSLCALNTYLPRGTYTAVPRSPKKAGPEKILQNKPVEPVK